MFQTAVSYVPGGLSLWMEFAAQQRNYAAAVEILQVAMDSQLQPAALEEATGAWLLPSPRSCVNRGVRRAASQTLLCPSSFRRACCVW